MFSLKIASLVFSPVSRTVVIDVARPVSTSGSLFINSQIPVDKKEAASSGEKTPHLPNGEKLIWEDYKRNHKGSIPPQKTRLRCKRIAGRRQIVGNPCPICKNDTNVHFENVKLLKQFICPHTGNILPATKTGVCRLQQKNLVAAIEKAWDHGLIPFTVPQEVILPNNFHPHQKPVLPTWNKVEVLDSNSRDNTL